MNALEAFCTVSEVAANERIGLDALLEAYNKCYTCLCSDIWADNVLLQTFICTKMREVRELCLRRMRNYELDVRRFAAQAKGDRELADVLSKNERTISEAPFWAQMNQNAAKNWHLYRLEEL
jgi:hypothetical protein